MTASVDPLFARRFVAKSGFDTEYHDMLPFGLRVISYRNDAVLRVKPNLSFRVLILTLDGYDRAEA